MNRQYPVFVSRAAFRFPVPNCGSLKEQRGRAGVPHIVGSGGFQKQVLASRPEMIARSGAIDLSVLPFERWSDTAFDEKRILFILPPPAIGEHVAIRLFLETFRAARRPGPSALLGTDAASDVYAGLPGFALFPLWMPHGRLAEFDLIVDLNDLPSRREIAFWPVDMEAELYAVFALTAPPPPAARIRSRGPGKPLRIGLFPLATSPVRTLQPKLLARLHPVLARLGAVEIVLNRWQSQSDLLRQGLKEAGIEPAYRTGLRTLADLQRFLGRIDYGVFADSGPAHLSKLDAVPGAAIYSSAPAAPLLGHHRNLVAIQAEYRSDWCQAPCGLAKLRRTADGRIGCMASLGVASEDLVAEAGSDGADTSTTRRFLLETPVPCASALSADAATIAERISADIRDRLGVTA